MSNLSNLFSSSENANLIENSYEDSALSALKAFFNERSLIVPHPARKATSRSGTVKKQIFLKKFN
jgi:hypothetical protein